MANHSDHSVSIIIRCYNEEEHIGRLLAGVLQQSLKNVEIILVDSGSTDATLAIASRYPVKIISIKKEDFSFGYSLNVGCSEATGEYLAIVSAHVYPVHHDWLEHLVAPFEDERIALVYGCQRGNETTRLSEHQVFAKWFPGSPDRNQGHPFCNNANAAIRKTLWDRFPYDESLTGLEDIAWARQTLGAGYRVAYESFAEIIHVHDESNSELLNRYRREAIAMKEIFPHERFSLFDFFHMFTKNVASDFSRAFKLGVFWNDAVSVMMFRLMQFWGTYLGYTQQGTVSRRLKSKFYYPNEAVRERRSNDDLPERPTIDYTGLDGPDQQD